MISSQQSGFAPDRTVSPQLRLGLSPDRQRRGVGRHEQHGGGQVHQVEDRQQAQVGPLALIHLNFSRVHHAQFSFQAVRMVHGTQMVHMEMPLTVC